MGEYLKKFNSHSEYETFKQSQQYIEPNVSVCVTENDIHYNPIAAVVHEYVDLGLPSGTLWATEGQTNILIGIFGQIIQLIMLLAHMIMMTKPIME